MTRHRRRRFDVWNEALMVMKKMKTSDWLMWRDSNGRRAGIGDADRNLLRVGRSDGSIDDEEAWMKKGVNGASVHCDVGW